MPLALDSGGTQVVVRWMPRPLLWSGDSDCQPSVMADFVRYELEDGSEVYFESSEGSLVSLRGGAPDVVGAGKLGDRLRQVAGAAEEVSRGLRERLGPEEIELTFGVKVSGGVDWWFFAKASGDASINVKLTWKSE
jgi:Trypsin-co-occurring domain 1